MSSTSLIAGGGRIRPRIRRVDSSMSVGRSVEALRTNTPALSTLRRIGDRRHDARRESPDVGCKTCRRGKTSRGRRTRACGAGHPVAVAQAAVERSDRRDRDRAAFRRRAPRARAHGQGRRRQRPTGRGRHRPTRPGAGGTTGRAAHRAQRREPLPERVAARGLGIREGARGGRRCRCSSRAAAPPRRSRSSG